MSAPRAPSRQLLHRLPALRPSARKVWGCKSGRAQACFVLTWAWWNRTLVQKVGPQQGCLLLRAARPHQGGSPWVHMDGFGFRAPVPVSCSSPRERALGVCTDVLCALSHRQLEVSSWKGLRGPACVVSLSEDHRFSQCSRRSGKPRCPRSPSPLVARSREDSFDPRVFSAGFCLLPRLP